MLRIVWSASLAWIGCIVVGILVDVPFQALKELTVPRSQRGWTDVLILSLIAVATAWVYLRELHANPSRSALIAVGMLWVLLSVLFVVGYSAYLTDHHVMRFLTEVVVGGTRVSGGALWALVLLAQLCAPFSVGILRDTHSRRRTMSPGNAH